MLSNLIFFLIATAWTVVVFVLGLFIGMKSMIKTINDAVEKYGYSYTDSWEKRHPKVEE